MGFAILSFFSAQSQSCYDRGQFIDVSKSGGPINAQGQTLDEYCYSFRSCPMPKFKTVLTEGTLISNDSAKGKISVLYFWSLHQSMNTNEVGYLNKLVDTFKGQNILFLAVCLDDPDKWDKRAESFFHFKHIAQSKPIKERFKSQPVVIIFDRNGKTAFYDNGLTEYDQVLKERFNKYLRVIKDNL